MPEGEEIKIKIRSKIRRGTQMHPAGPAHLLFTFTTRHYPALRKIAQLAQGDVVLAVFGGAAADDDVVEQLDLQ